MRSGASTAVVIAIVLSAVAAAAPLSGQDEDVARLRAAVDNHGTLRVEDARARSWATSTPSW